MVQRATELRQEQANQERISVATLEALVNALEAKDPYLRGHSARVADLSAMIAAQIGSAMKRWRRYARPSQLHDIGKIGIREEVLNERSAHRRRVPSISKQHPLVRCRVTRTVGPPPKRDHVRSQPPPRAMGRLRLPDRLAGDAIPLGARWSVLRRSVCVDHGPALSGEDVAGGRPWSACATWRNRD